MFVADKAGTIAAPTPKGNPKMSRRDYTHTETSISCKWWGCSRGGCSVRRNLWVRRDERKTIERRETRVNAVWNLHQYCQQIGQFLAKLFQVGTDAGIWTDDTGTNYISFVSSWKENVVEESFGRFKCRTTEKHCLWFRCGSSPEAPQLWHIIEPVSFFWYTVPCLWVTKEKTWGLGVQKIYTTVPRLSI